MTRKEQKNIFLLKIFIFDDFSDIVKCHWKLNFLKKTIKSSKMKMKTVYIFFALSISYWTYIPKIRVVGQMGWPVENTKIKRKNMKNCPKIDNFQKFKIFILHLFKTNWNTHLFQSTCFYMQRGLSKIEICWVQKWWERLIVCMPDTVLYTTRVFCSYRYWVLCLVGGVFSLSCVLQIY